jgi:hypothetical protein
LEDNVQNTNLIAKTGFVTYNTVGEGLASGWHDGPSGRRALVLQNSKGEAWGAADPATYDYTPSEGDGLVARRDAEIRNLWGQLREALPELDHLVVYVGANGSQRAIAMAAVLPATKVTLVGCDCGIRLKTDLARSHGLAKAAWVDCECGGHRTMRKLFEAFMETGTLYR